jgi:hypothetical protein
MPSRDVPVPGFESVDSPLLSLLRPFRNQHERIFLFESPKMFSFMFSFELKKKKCTFLENEKQKMKVILELAMTPPG